MNLAFTFTKTRILPYLGMGLSQGKTRVTPFPQYHNLQAVW